MQCKTTEEALFRLVWVILLIANKFLLNSTYFKNFQFYLLLLLLYSFLFSFLRIAYRLTILKVNPYGPYELPICMGCQSIWIHTDWFYGLSIRSLNEKKRRGKNEEEVKKG